MRLALWTPEEIGILQKFYPAEGVRVRDRLPDRSDKAINFKAYTLGLKVAKRSGVYVPAKKPKVVEPNYICGICGRPRGTEFSLRTHGHRDHPGRPRSEWQPGFADKRTGTHGFKAWTEAEDELVRRFYPSEGKSMADRLPGRSVEAVLSRASDLKVRAPRAVLRSKIADRQYSSILRDANKPLTETEQLAKLPWLKMPTTERGCLEVADACDFILANQPISTDARVSLSTLKGHVLALAERLKKKALAEV